jgi:arylsulfatase A-like enzyme
MRTGSRGGAARNGGRRSLLKTSGLILAIASIAALAVAGIGCGRPTARNVVVVCVDTLRADHVGAYGYSRATTPRLDALARGGALFENALATAPWTVPAVGSLLTSLYPSQHGAGLAGEVRQLDGNTPAQLRPEAETLADQLHRAKLRTALYSANPYLWGRFQRSFDHAEAGRQTARSLTDRALAWVRQAPAGPFFLYLQYMDLHQPIQPPEPFASHFVVPAGRRAPEHADWRFVRQEDWTAADFQSFREHKVALYDGALLYVDGEIGRLIDGLRKLGLLKDTLLVVTADHGEEFWDHGEEERLQGGDPRAIWGVGHGHTLYQELLHVPLILSGPGVAGGSRLPCPVALLDVAPTILAGLGFLPAAGMEGRSLLRSISPETAEDGRCAPRPLAAESPAYGPDARALLYRGWKLVLRKGAPPALYDLGRDPGEHRNLAAEAPGKLAVLTRVLEHELGGATALGAPALPDPETARQLHALGYL